VSIPRIIADYGSAFAAPSVAQASVLPIPRSYTNDFRASRHLR
jgi:hypothetical protein